MEEPAGRLASPIPDRTAHLRHSIQFGRCRRLVSKARGQRSPRRRWMTAGQYAGDHTLHGGLPLPEGVLRHDDETTSRSFRVSSVARSHGLIGARRSRRKPRDPPVRNGAAAWRGVVWGSCPAWASSTASPVRRWRCLRRLFSQWGPPLPLSATNSSTLYRGEVPDGGNQLIDTLSQRSA